MKRKLIPTLLVAGLVATAAATPVAAANGTPPGDASGGGTLENYCSFDVGFTLTGKSKLITKPNGQRIITSPGQRITLTANGKTLSYVITGTRFESDVQVNGETITEVKVTGRNILTNPIGVSVRPGLFLVVGNFNYALDAAGEEVRVFNANGPGKVTDVCQALS